MTTSFVLLIVVLIVLVILSTLIIAGLIDRTNDLEERVFDLENKQ